MTKEEFYHLAHNRPELTDESIYRLTIRFFNVNAKEYQQTPDKQEWSYDIYKTTRFFSTKENAKKAYLDYIHKSENIHSAIIDRLAINLPVDKWYNNAWWLFDKDGNEIDLGEEELGVTATIYPETADGTKISWSTSNDLVKIRVVDWTDDLETCSKISINRTGTESGVCEVTATAGDMSAAYVVNVLPDDGVESLLANPDNNISIYSTDGILIKKDCKVEDLKILSKGI